MNIRRPVMIGPWYAEVRRLPSDAERELMDKMTVEEREELDSVGHFNLKQSKWFNDQSRAVAWTSMMLRYQGFHISQVVPKSFRENLERAKIDEEYNAAIDKIPAAEQQEYQHLTGLFLKRFML